MKSKNHNLATIKRATQAASEASQQTLEALLASEPLVELTLHCIASKTGLDTTTIEREMRRLARKGTAVRVRKVWMYAHPDFLMKDAPTNTLDV